MVRSRIPPPPPDVSEKVDVASISKKNSSLWRIFKWSSSQ